MPKLLSEYERAINGLPGWIEQQHEDLIESSDPEDIRREYQVDVTVVLAAVEQFKVRSARGENVDHMGNQIKFFALAVAFADPRIRADFRRMASGGRIIQVSLPATAQDEPGIQWSKWSDEQKQEFAAGLDNDTLCQYLEQMDETIAWLNSEIAAGPQH